MSTKNHYRDRIASIGYNSYYEFELQRKQRSQGKLSKHDERTIQMYAFMVWEDPIFPVAAPLQTRYPVKVLK